MQFSRFKVDNVPKRDYGRSIKRQMGKCMGVYELGESKVPQGKVGKVCAYQCQDRLARYCQLDLDFETDYFITFLSTFLHACNFVKCRIQ